MTKPREGQFFHKWFEGASEAHGRYPSIGGEVISWISDQLLLVEVRATKSALFIADVKEAGEWSLYDTEQEWKDLVADIVHEVGKERQSRRADESKP